MRKRRNSTPQILDAMPGTRKEIQVRTGLSKSCVGRWVSEAHQNGLCHITKWVKPTNESRPTAVYKAGPGKDAVCRIKPKANSQIVRDYRHRLMKSGEWEHRKSRYRAKAWAEKAKKKRLDPLMAAFYGDAR